MTSCLPLLVTFGLSIIIQNGLLEVFSADSQRLSAGVIETDSIRLGAGIAVGTVQLFTLASAVGVIFGLKLLFYRTEVGRAFRATSATIRRSRNSWASTTGTSFRWRWLWRWW